MTHTNNKLEEFPKYFETKTKKSHDEKDEN
jgi:hypothetical protein